jgi:hypothetical protein
MMLGLDKNMILNFWKQLKYKEDKTLKGPSNNLL